MAEKARTAILQELSIQTNEVGCNRLAQFFLVPLERACLRNHCHDVGLAYWAAIFVWQPKRVLLLLSLCVFIMARRILLLALLTLLATLLSLASAKKGPLVTNKGVVFFFLDLISTFLELKVSI